MNCLHGMNPEWCALCLGQVRATTGGGQSFQAKPRRVSNPALIAKLKEIKAKPHRPENAGYYGVYFNTCHAAEVQLLSDSPVFRLNDYFSEISCKDVFQDLFGLL